MNRTALRRALVGSSLTALTLAATATGVASAKPGGVPAGPKPVEVQLLAINDFHGQLEALDPAATSSGRIQTGPNSSTDRVAAGGAEYLATQLARLAEEQKKKNSITVAAGDLIGASPLLSAAFHDEPAIEALNLMGLDYATVGNHEFDEGPAELLRIQNGGCHPVDGCADGTPYEGADFQYLSANVFEDRTDAPLLPPYAIHKVQGVEIGFIGMTLEGTPNIVTAEGTAGLEFHDEIETANHYAAELQAQGVESIVVLLHEGGQQNGANAWNINQCNGFTGPIVDIANGMSDAIDVVVSGHTHNAYNCEIDGKLVTSASSQGRLVTDIDLSIDRRTGDIVTAQAENVIVTRDVARDADQTALIARYNEVLGPIASEVVGATAAPLNRTREQLFQSGVSSSGQPVFALGESTLGSVIADAQLAATDDEQGAVAALMNPGGVRADLDAGPVTYAEAFAVQPFANVLTTLDLTGAQLQCLLEQGFQGNNTPLYPSSTLTYQVDRSGTSAAVGANPCSGTRVPDASVAIDGQPVVATETYRITVNNFLAGGGDGYTVLRDFGDNAVTSMDDLDALIAYLSGPGSPIPAPTDDRIVAIN
ncbi:UNVERIFIED_ORG: bifunctional metallophosphatase/5'-nucleotidase [Bacillus sp. AZ43]